MSSQNQQFFIPSPTLPLRQHSLWTAPNLTIENSTLDCPKHSSLRENISNFDPIDVSVRFFCEEANVISDEPPPQSKDPT